MSARTKTASDDRPALTRWTVVYWWAGATVYVNDQSGVVRTYLDEKGIPWRWARPGNTR